MLELLFDPGFIAFVGTITGAVLLKFGERRLSKKKPKAVEAPKSAKPDPTECQLYFQREFEKKLVDAGIMTKDEMSVCEDKDCVDCYPKGHWCEPCQAYLETPDMHKNVHTSNSNPKCHRCGTGLAYDGICEPCYYASAQNKKTYVNGEWVNRPGDVPEYAHATLEDTSGLVFWSWTDPATGKSMGMKSYHTDHLFRGITVGTIKDAVWTGVSALAECQCDYTEIEVDHLLDAAVAYKESIELQETQFDIVRQL